MPNVGKAGIMYWIFYLQQDMKLNHFRINKCQILMALSCTKTLQFRNWGSIFCQYIIIQIWTNRCTKTDHSTYSTFVGRLGKKLLMKLNIFGAHEPGQNLQNFSNHQPHDCLLNRLFRRGSKKTPKFRVTGLCAGNSLVTGEIPAQMASNAKNVSIW